jgi:hypothetical protein
VAPCKQLEVVIVVEEAIVATEFLIVTEVVLSHGLLATSASAKF